VGGGSHIPCYVAAVEAEMLTMAPSAPPVLRRTLNAAEAVARGCALTAALHSEAFRLARPFRVWDALPRSLEVRSGKGRLLLPRLERGMPLRHHPQGGYEAEVEMDGEDEEEGEVEGGGGLEVRVEEEGSGLVAARGFSRLFSNSVEAAGRGAGGGERLRTWLKLDAWGRPSLGPLRIARWAERETEGGEGQEGGGKAVAEEEVLGAEWEAGALPSKEELESGTAVEDAMAAVDREVEECLEAKNALESLVYRCKGGEEAGAGPEARALAEAVETWLEEREGEAEHEGAVGEYEEKREGLLAALARDVRAARAEVAAGVGEKAGWERAGQSQTPTTDRKGEEEEDGVEVVFDLEGEGESSEEADTRSGK